jgi:hypothetical protein
MLDGSVARGAIVAPPAHLLATNDYGQLTRDTIKLMADFFAKKNHRPSIEQWEALADLVTTMERMAKGEAPAKFYLSSLDPGVGKTTALRFFIDTLLSKPWHQDVGVLLCVARLDEVKNLVESIGIPTEMLCVMTSRVDLNAMGGASADEARVLITTQQMVERRINGGDFKDASDFHFNGHPRRVRLWDESYLPGAAISIGRYAMSSLFERLAGPHPALTRQLEDVFTALRDVPDGTLYVLPDFAEIAAASGTDLNDLLRLFDWSDKDDDAKRRDLSFLWWLSDRTVVVRKDDATNRAAVEYNETLPADLAPMVILDASGRVRSTYSDMENDRGMLVRLKSATKLYDKLTVHTWTVGGGKRAFQRNGNKLMDGIARTIDTKSDERWLVVVHQKDARVGDVQKGVSERLLKTPSGNVKFITWGNHMASNDYVEFSNVILAGTLFYRTSHYDALKRLASGRRPTDGPVTKTELEKTQDGENMHLILQALCRGSVRKSDGESCHPCDAYIIASVRSRIPGLLADIFPGCQQRRWRPIERTLQGHVRAAIEYIGEHLFAEGSMLKFTVVQKALGMSRQDFRTDVRKNDDFRDALSEMGVEELAPHGKYATCFWLPFEAVE